MSNASSIPSVKAELVEQKTVIAIDKLPIKPQQRLLLYTYCHKNLTFKDALIEAGYSVSNVSKSKKDMLGNEHMAKYIENYDENQAKRAELAQNYTIDIHREQILDFIERAKTSKNLTAEGKGIELLGKTIGAYTDKVEHTDKSDRSQVLPAVKPVGAPVTDKSENKPEKILAALQIGKQGIEVIETTAGTVGEVAPPQDQGRPMENTVKKYMNEQARKQEGE